MWFNNPIALHLNKKYFIPRCFKQTKSLNNLNLLVSSNK